MKFWQEKVLNISGHSLCIPPCFFKRYCLGLTGICQGSQMEYAWNSAKYNISGEFQTKRITLLQLSCNWWWLEKNQLPLLMPCNPLITRCRFIAFLLQWDVLRVNLLHASEVWTKNECLQNVFGSLAWRMKFYAFCPNISCSGWPGLPKPIS